jgi:folylpolyglutamate synthase/dihydropteroate synthase
MLPGLAARAQRVVLTRAASPRAAEPAALAALVPGTTDILLEPEIEPALAKALAGEPGLVVACGSLYLIGALRRLLRSR